MSDTNTSDCLVELVNKFPSTLEKEWKRVNKFKQVDTIVRIFNHPVEGEVTVCYNPEWEYSYETNWFIAKGIYATPFKDKKVFPLIGHPEGNTVTFNIEEDSYDEDDEDEGKEFNLSFTCGLKAGQYMSEACSEVITEVLTKLFSKGPGIRQLDLYSAEAYHTIYFKRSKNFGPKEAERFIVEKLVAAGATL